MKAISCPGDACGKPYQVNEFSAQYISGGGTGKIVCPHCGGITVGSESTVYLTHPVPESGQSCSPQVTSH